MGYHVLNIISALPPKEIIKVPTDVYRMVGQQISCLFITYKEIKLDCHSSVNKGMDAVVHNELRRISFWSLSFYDPTL